MFRNCNRFLEEVKAAGQLSESQERYSQLPIVSILPIVGELSKTEPYTTAQS